MAYRRCGFLNTWPMIGGVLIPMGLVIIYDTVIFTMVIRRLSHQVAGRQITRTQREERIRRVQNAAALVVLLGLTWGLGYLMIIENASFAFQVVFVVFNSLQGVFIFFFYCLRNQAARDQWRRTVCCCDLSQYDVCMCMDGSYTLSRSSMRTRATNNSSTMELSTSTSTTKSRTGLYKPATETIEEDNIMAYKNGGMDNSGVESALNEHDSGDEVETTLETPKAVDDVSDNDDEGDRDSGVAEDSFL